MQASRSSNLEKQPPAQGRFLLALG
ncbi:hypothetical protein ZEAMMB73_Zm00001d040793 [Zea mays]|uniref:Uncharacterized protein n=1 Tax=Zea mays TaxID=4577 RepID=A0A1D6MT00_MAIZE|nr:hypothetical protein ZEAMMB73_Zm00001d040793 [Zea mays]